MPSPTTIPTPTASAYATDDLRWQAVLDRDPQADGHFYLCVHTTGIYCRPTCPARKPKRENTHFVTTRAEAIREGYRACKRCTPDDATSFPQRQAELIAQACALIERTERRLTLDEIAAHIGMSPYHVHRVFKQVTGVTPKAYGDAHRAERVRTQLATTPSVTQAIHESGFTSNGRFYETSTKLLGMTPGDVRRGASGMAIRVAIEPCSLGLTLVAATDRGICSVMLGDDPQPLMDELLRRFPKAGIETGDETFADLVAEVIAVIEEPSRSLDLPLDVRGTAFQQRVWQALREIPVGTTATYSEVADAIGEPKAVRAVAQACGRNKIAVVIPCHRVIGKDGSLTGYAWGTERKQTLLERERLAAADN